MIQGAFAGVMVPQAMSYVQTEFPHEEVGKAFGLFGITFPIGGASGPVLGGLLTHADIAGLGWRSIFLVNVPVGAFAVIMTALAMPVRGPGSRVRIDALGVLLLALPLISRLYPLIQGWQNDWPAWSFPMMVATLPLLGIFAVSQRYRVRRGHEPLIRLNLLRRRGFGPSLAVAVLFFASMGTFFVLTLYLQGSLGYSALTTGLTFLPTAVGIAVGNMIAMQLATNAGPWFIRSAISVCGIGIGGLILAVSIGGHGLQPWEIIPSALIRAGTLPSDAAQIALLTELGLLAAALIATVGLSNRGRAGVTQSQPARLLAPDTAAETGTPAAPE